ncbi:MAG: exodeoxyribonuclease VII large subunit [Firmicutes bacterium HGW-Firmicutes-20]|jgi:exodeoxyribonuclease VII large subunit|nr:MAG: exodeoxyribonuclease VII large subunit [Firmicutes bacterium HGW-Firmicutes-20]
MSQSIWTVTALIRFIKKHLETESTIQYVAVQGEISNFTAHRSGHWYFTLKDNQSRCSCVMFATAASKVSLVPKDGDQVIVVGSVSVFEASGQMQLYVTRLIPQGLGALYAKLEALKKKLSQAGIFDDTRKKAIPAYPESIGVITSKNTAAYQDVMSTLKRRWPLADVVHYHSAVQGEGSIEQLVDAINLADGNAHDVMLLVRGGGSIEDLWSFNEEPVVMAIAACKTPFISGVGHQSDVTLVDFVADVRAPTPTGAAEMATPDQNDVQLTITKNLGLLKYKLNAMTSEKRRLLVQYKDHRYLKDPTRLLNEYQMSLSFIYQQLDKQQLKVIRYQRLIDDFRKQLIQQSNDKLFIHKTSIDKLQVSMKHQLMVHIVRNNDKIKLRRQLLESLSPLAVLNRGYAITYQQAKLITSIHQLDKNKELTIRYADGTVDAKIIQIKESNHGKNNL